MFGGVIVSQNAGQNVDQAEGLRKLINEKTENLKSASANKAGNNAPRVIAVTSGKGGVGKTNITGNLAIALTKMGKKVMVFDADLGLANIDIIYGINPRYNIAHVLAGEMSLSEVLTEGPHGVKIIPAGSGFVNLTQLTEGEKLNLLGEFESMNEELDYLLIDTGAGISTNVLYFNLAADECIVIATQEPTSLTDAYAMMKVMSNSHGAKRFKLLVNMVADAKEAKQVYLTLVQAADKFLNNVVLEYMGFIPIDNSVRNAVRTRTPAIDAFPKGNFAKGITDLAMRIDKSPRPSDYDGNIKFFLKRFMDYSLKPN